MSQASTIRSGRRFNEALMKSKVRVFIVIGKKLDRTTLKNRKETTDLYVGKGKIRIAAASAGISEREPLGQQLAVQVNILSLPVAVEPPGEGSTLMVGKNSYVEILENEDDPALVGHIMRVKGNSAQTSATARRFVVEEVS